MKKFLPYILISIILVGLFGLTAEEASASRTNPNEDCAYLSGQGNSNIATNSPCVDRRVGGTGVTQATAVVPAPVPCTGINNGVPIPAGCTGANSSSGSTPFEKELKSCSIFSPSTWGLCLVWLFYITYFQVPAVILAMSAWFFNAMVNLGIDSAITINSGFIPGAWAVVRDLSNIFFILVLLYVAIQTILGLSHEAKKVIVRVVIIGLLINFSMFFSKIVIDTSNILALVFYNKLEVNKDRPIDPSRPKTEKDISGEMWKTFDATRLISEDTIKKLKTTVIDDNGQAKTVTEKTMPVSFAFGMVVIAGSIMLWAAYAFFIAGLMFIGRLIELWVLIIFSPFAFMSWTIPVLSGTPYIGWNDWSKKIIATSFMAPIFMFFIYLIFLALPHMGVFNNGVKNLTILDILLQILIPAIIVMALLLKAVEFAKKGGGEFGEMILKGGKMVGGLALGAATGGAGLALRATAGRAGAAIAESGWAKNREAQGKFGSGVFRSAAKAVGSGSFDIRGLKIGGSTLAGATGINMGEAQKGGFVASRKEQVKKRQERAKELEVGEDETLKQNLNTMEKDLQELLKANGHEIEQIDKRIKTARENASDAATALRADPNNTTKQARAKETSELVTDLRAERSAIKNGRNTYVRSAARAAAGEPLVATFMNNRTASGKSINDLEDHDIPHAHDVIEKENRSRRWSYAAKEQTGWGRTKGYILSGGAYTKATSAEAAHKIRMEAKIESGGDKGGGHGGGGGGGHAPAPAAHTPAPAPAAPDGRGGGGGGGHGPAHP